MDVIATGNFGNAGKNDTLELAFDYRQAEKMVREIMAGPSKKLIETLCLEIGDSIFNTHLNIEKLQVAVRKLNPPLPSETEYAEVLMTWKR